MNAALAPLTWKSDIEFVVIPGAVVLTWPVGPLVMAGPDGAALPWFVIATVSAGTAGRTCVFCTL